ncbi:hypothetical protein G6F65_023005 [Rhizopus arrhizus]|nr:hypothetical protein G6F65_023005 [Rhizopus arrhizus]
MAARALCRPPCRARCPRLKSAPSSRNTPKPRATPSLPVSTAWNCMPPTATWSTSSWTRTPMRAPTSTAVRWRTASGSWTRWRAPWSTPWAIRPASASGWRR